jgi:hypothetical protein
MYLEMVFSLRFVVTVLTAVPDYVFIVDSCTMLLESAFLLRFEVTVLTAMPGHTITITIPRVNVLVIIVNVFIVIVVNVFIVIIIDVFIVIIIDVVIVVCHRHSSLSLLAPAVGLPFSYNLHILILITWLAKELITIQSFDTTCCRCTLVPSCKDTKVRRWKFFSLNSSIEEVLGVFLSICDLSFLDMTGLCDMNSCICRICPVNLQILSPEDDFGQTKPSFCLFGCPISTNLHFSIKIVCVFVYAFIVIFSAILSYSTS